MATQAVLPPTVSAAAVPTSVPVVTRPLLPERPVVPPAGSYAASGPTTGQIFPVGNR